MSHDYTECVAERDQRQDSLADQLRDLVPLANRLGCYDAADFIESVLERDEVQRYGETRTVSVPADGDGKEACRPGCRAQTHRVNDDLCPACRVRSKEK